MPPHTFTARQIVDLTGMGYPVLSDLLRRGVVAPSKHRGAGTGDNHLFDACDLFGIASVQHLRPKAETTELLRSVFNFWHSDDGRRIVEPGGGHVVGVVVIDASGHVALERETDVMKLAALRESPALQVIEPNMLRQRLFSDVGMFRIVGDHLQPLPSGREPRGRNQKPRHVKSADGRSETRTAPTKKTKRRRKKMPVPALLRKAGRRSVGPTKVGES